MLGDVADRISRCIGTSILDQTYSDGFSPRERRCTNSMLQYCWILATHIDASVLKNV